MAFDWGRFLQGAGQAGATFGQAWSAQREKDEEEKRREEKEKRDRALKVLDSQVQQLQSGLLPANEATVRQLEEKYAALGEDIGLVATAQMAGTQAQAATEAKRTADAANQAWMAKQRAHEEGGWPAEEDKRALMGRKNLVEGQELDLQRAAIAGEPRAQEKLRQYQAASKGQALERGGQELRISPTTLFSTGASGTETYRNQIAKKLADAYEYEPSKVPFYQALYDSTTEEMNQRVRAGMKGEIPSYGGLQATDKLDLMGRTPAPAPEVTQPQQEGPLAGIPADFIVEGRSRGATDEQIKRAWQDYLSSQGR